MKKINLTRIAAYFASILLVFTLLVKAVLAFEYTLLDPSILNKGEGAKVTSWREYLQLAITAFYTFLASAAVFVITVYGIKYMLSEIPNVKKDASSRIWDAIIGLVLALSAYLILQIINPTLLKDNFSSSINGSQQYIPQDPRMPEADPNGF